MYHSLLIRSRSRSKSRSSSPEVVQSIVEYITEFGAASDDEGQFLVCVISDWREFAHQSKGVKLVFYYQYENCFYVH